MVSQASAKPSQLEDLMIAMDVVDTLRHRGELVDRELDADARRQRMIERLKQIYTAQGIEVTDAALAEGVRAMEEERFRYSPPPPSFSVKLATLYATRGRWGKPLLGFLGLLGMAVLAYWLLVSLPNARARAELDEGLDREFAQIVNLSQSEEATDTAEALLDQARQAIEREDYRHAKKLFADLRAIQTTLNQDFELRIVARANELSGIWRVPAVNPNARNYYLIVEAVDPRGKIVPYSVENEEDGSRKTVTKWGVRVDRETFDAVARDKRDDGIIQNNIIGQKQRGYLRPEYAIPTSGATITDW